MRVLAIIGALAIVVGIGAAVYFFGGFYSVAGTVEDPAVVHWALVKVRTVSVGLHPDPPDLLVVVGGATPSQLFWVIKNGINMTGMPSFGAVGVSDEDIWEIVAFLKQLPKVSEADYKAWTAPAAPPASAAPAAPAPPAAAPPAAPAPPAEPPK